jgi:hypothetical protein
MSVERRACRQRRQILPFNAFRTHFILLHDGKCQVGFQKVNRICTTEICGVVSLVWQMLENERDSITTFSTGCPIIDSTLGGGVRLGQVTELYGESGCGKTQLCIQMSLEVQRTFRARGKEASKPSLLPFVHRHSFTSGRGGLHQYGISN